MIPAGTSVKLDAEFEKKPSFDFDCITENKGISGYDLVTKLGSNLTFTGQTTKLEDRGQIEIVRQNFGFDLANGINEVELDLNEPHYYLEVRTKKEKYIYDENNGLWYELQGDYYIPCLTIPEEEQRTIGIWGRRHLRYIREYRKGLYNSLLLSGKLNSYLADLNKQAEEMLIRLVNGLAEKEGITETLKASDQMEWVQRMNAVWEAAAEIVNNDLIYA